MSKFHKLAEIGQLPSNIEITAKPIGGRVTVTPEAGQFLVKPTAKPKSYSSREIKQFENLYKQAARTATNFVDNFEAYLNRSWLKFVDKKGYKSPTKTAKRLAQFEKEKGRQLQRTFRRYKKSGKDVTLAKGDKFRESLKRVRFEKREYQRTTAGAGPTTRPKKIVRIITITSGDTIFTEKNAFKVLNTFSASTSRGPFLGYYGKNSYFGTVEQYLGLTDNDLKTWLILQKQVNNALLPVWASYLRVWEYIDEKGGPAGIDILADVYDYRETW